MRFLRTVARARLLIWVARVCVFLALASRTPLAGAVVRPDVSTLIVRTSSAPPIGSVPPAAGGSKPESG